MQFTPKDLNYLMDEAKQELLVAKKCNHFSKECSDKEVQELINKVGKMHQKHFEKLVSKLKE